MVYKNDTENEQEEVKGYSTPPPSPIHGLECQIAQNTFKYLVPVCMYCTMYSIAFVLKVAPASSTTDYRVFSHKTIFKSHGWW